MTSGGPSGAIRLRELEEGDEQQVLALLTASLAGGPTGRRTTAFFRWKHRANVFGASPGLVALAGDQVVGVRLLLRWEFTAGGTVVRALRPVDTATHPDFRGRGVFRRLTLGLLERVADGADLVFNTPNSTSLPGYLGMGWRRAGTVPIAVRPARPLAFLCGIGGGLVRRGRPAGRKPRAAAVPAPPGTRCSLPPAGDVLESARGLGELLRERAEAEAAERPARLGTARTERFLRWRYAPESGLDYRAVTVERGGDLAGIALCRPRWRGRLAELTLSDVIVRPGDLTTAARLLRSAASAGCDHVATHLAEGTEGRRVLLRSGYLRAPGTGMALVVRGGPAAPDPALLRSWRFTLGDLEVF